MKTKYLLVFIFCNCQLFNPPQNQIVMNADSTGFRIMYTDSTFSAEYVRIDTAETAQGVRNEIKRLDGRIDMIEADTGSTVFVWDANEINPRKPVWWYNVYFDSVLIGSTKEPRFPLSGKNFNVTAHNKYESHYSGGVELKGFR